MPNLRKDRLYGWAMNFQRAFTLLLALLWLWQAQLSDDVFRALKPSTHDRKERQRMIAQKYRFRFHRRSDRFRKQLLGDIMEYSLIPCQRIKYVVVFDFMCLVIPTTSCFDRWKERVPWKLVSSFVPKVHKMRQAARYWKSRRGKLLYFFLCIPFELRSFP